MKKKLITIALLSALALTSLTACSDTSDDATSDTSVADNSAADTTTEAQLPIPELDLGGGDFNVYLWSNSYIPVTEESGDVIDDAIYKRNLAVEDEYNLKFKFDVRAGAGTDYANWLSVLEATILAGDDTYQLAGGYGHNFVLDSLGTYYHNLNAISSIDFSQPWWPSNINEAGNVGSSLFLCFGDFEPSFYDQNYCVYFNKNLATGFGLDDLYSTVKSNAWTFEKLSEYAKLGAADLDGDSKMTISDQYGMIIPRAMSLDAFIQAFDIKITETDSDGMPRLVGVTQKYADAVALVNGFIYDSGYVGYNIDALGEGDLLKAVFMPGRALFACGSITNAHIFREMDDDFGILPYPMYDEAQGRYITHNANGNSTGMAIPTTADAEKSGAVLEALSYFGKRDILPEYYERALKAKGTRDDDSAEMLDIIFSNVEFEFTQYYSYCFGAQKAPSMLMRILVRDNSNNIASAWEKDQQIYDATMETIINALK